MSNSQDTGNSRTHPLPRTFPRTDAGSITISADLGNVGLRSQADHDVQFLQLDIDGVVVLHEEHLDFLLQDFRPEGNKMLFHPRLVQTLGSILNKGTFSLELYPDFHCKAEWCYLVSETHTKQQHEGS